MVFSLSIERNRLIYFISWTTYGVKTLVNKSGSNGFLPCDTHQLAEITFGLSSMESCGIRFLAFDGEILQI